MAELKGKKQKQPSSRPQNWLAAAMVVQLELTCRQQRYAKRSVGIARFVYNRLVANDQAARDASLWLTPHQLEKELNAAKRTDTSLSFITEVSKFIAQGACRNYRNAHLRWRQNPQSPQAGLSQEETHGYGKLPRSLGNHMQPVRSPPAHTPPLPGKRPHDPRPPGGNSIRSDHQPSQRPLIRQHRLLETPA